MSNRIFIEFFSKDPNETTKNLLIAQYGLHRNRINSRLNGIIANIDGSAMSSIIKTRDIRFANFTS